MYCSNCAADLPADANFCYKCAKPIAANFNGGAARPVVPLTKTAEKPPVIVVKHGSGIGGVITSIFSILLLFVIVAAVGIGGLMYYRAHRGNYLTIDKNGISGQFDFPSESKTVPQSPKTSAPPKNNTLPTQDLSVHCTVKNNGKDSHLRKNCDSEDCDNDPNTIAAKITDGSEVIREDKEIQSTYGYTWVEIIAEGEKYYISSKKLYCE